MRIEKERTLELESREDKLGFVVRQRNRFVEALC